MTGDERGLVEAIRVDPEDDVVRLVYADWLEENGHQDRADLIRVQIELANKRGGDEAMARETELKRRLKADWPEGLAVAGVVYRRGMGFVKWDSLEKFTRGADTLREAGPPPWVVEVEFAATKRRNDEAAMGRLDGRDLALLTGLTLADQISRFGGRHVALSPHLTRLGRLALENCPLTPDEVVELVESPALAGLRGLRMMFGTLAGEAGVRAFAGADGLPILTELYLTSNRIGDARLRRLLKSPILGRLERLVLADNAIRAGGAKAIAGCERLRGLRHLNLNGNQIDDEGARALLDSPNLGALRSLDLQWQPKISEATKQRLRKRFAKVKA